jgi:hypothetical protein
MAKLKPRRCKLKIEDRKLLHEPTQQGNAWSLRLPFCETFRNVYQSMCDVDSNQLKAPLQKGNGNCYAYLKDESLETLNSIKNWIDVIGSYVVIRDYLALSLAIDYGFIDGNPDNSRTRIGLLRSKAKPYNTPVTLETFNAADEIFKICMQFFSDIYCYNSADAIVAMPASKPDKEFDLPLYLVKKISKEWNKEDLSYAVQTTKARPSVKDQETIEGKLEALEGSVQIDPDIVQGKSIVILDDLYQSGISMNYVAMLLQEAGAKKVFGLACEKTSRNDVNPSRR